MSEISYTELLNTTLTDDYLNKFSIENVSSFLLKSLETTNAQIIVKYLNSNSRIDLYIKMVYKFLAVTDLKGKEKFLDSIYAHLLSQFDNLKSETLVYLLDFSLNELKCAKLVNYKILGLLPKLIESLKYIDSVSIKKQNNSLVETMSGVEYRDNIIERATTLNWENTQLIINMAISLVEIDLNEGQRKFLATKLIRLLKLVELEDVPTLAYQILLLSKKGNKSAILLGISKFFENEAKTDSQQSILKSQGIVLTHITFAIKQDFELGNEFLKICKKETLSTFKLSLLLSMATIYRFEYAVFEYLKSFVFVGFCDEQRKLKIPWIRKHKNLVYESLEDILSAVIVQNTSREDDPTELTQNVGIRALRVTFNNHKFIQPIIIEQVLARIESKTVGAAKAIYLTNEKRQIALAGYLELLSSRNYLRPTNSQFLNRVGSFSSEILDILKNCFNDQCVVKKELYGGLAEAALVRPPLAEYFLTYIGDNDLIKVDACLTNTNGGEPKIHEPMYHALKCICDCLLMVKHSDSEILINYRERLDSIIAKHCNASINDFELDKDGDYSSSGNIGKRNQYRVIVLIGIYIVFMEYSFKKSEILILGKKVNYEIFSAAYHKMLALEKLVKEKEKISGFSNSFKKFDFETCLQFIEQVFGADQVVEELAEELICRFVSSSLLESLQLTIASNKPIANLNPYIKLGTLLYSKFIEAARENGLSTTQIGKKEGKQFCDAKTYREAGFLIDCIQNISNVVDDQEICKLMQNWLIDFLKKRDIKDLGLAKKSVQLLIVLENVNRAGDVSKVVLNSIIYLLDDIEWCIMQISKSRKAKDNRFVWDEFEAIICKHLEPVINVMSDFEGYGVIVLILNYLFSRIVFDGFVFELRMKAIDKCFKVLSNLVKQNTLILTLKLLSLPHGNDIEETEDLEKKMKLGGKKRKIKDAQLKATKESKFVPKIVFLVENFERHLIQLSTKSKVNLTRYIKVCFILLANRITNSNCFYKRSTARDFRIRLDRIEENEDDEVKVQETEKENLSSINENVKKGKFR
ncbi:hypothetical protein HK099_004855 [Clydaea vesicula]|uniref:Uncharacterized protein n=1 Tax=Clydaea vesicula TaxID=447962 RepID=A0AAD5U2F4_9FUNG|nr:hypothetical protein HK099_004855 [Clydaea vesicula]